VLAFANGAVEKSIGKLRNVLAFPEGAVEKCCKFRNVSAFVKGAVKKGLASLDMG